MATLTQTPSSLTAVIITKNEERRIGRLLESLLFADEVVVVDDESIDGTVELCRRHGAKVISHRSEGDFDHQRNLGIDLAQGTWILQLDADEVIPPLLQREIRSALSTPSSYVAYGIKRQNCYLGKWMQSRNWYGNYQVKLFRKDQARYIGSSVHEQLRVEGPTGQLQHDVLHFPYESLVQVLDRMNYYTSVEAKVLARRSGSVAVCHIAYQLTARPVKLFWKLFVKKQAWRDGFHGFLFSVLDTFSQFMQWAKYWERTLEHRAR